MKGVQLPDSDIWFVRAELGNVLAGHFLENGIVSMGWEIGPIKDDDSDDEIMGRLESLYPDAKVRTLQTWAAEIKRFNRKMEAGDAVATYEPRGRMYHVGIIRSLLIPAELGYQSEYPEYKSDYVHRVEWLHQIPKNILSEYTRRRLSIPLTLHRLSQEASAELRQYCSV